MTINTHKGFTYFNRKFILHELREAVREVSADLVFLQEVLGAREKFSQRHREVWPASPQYEFLADNIWSDFAYGRNAVYPNGHHGNALLSKFPIVQYRNQDVSLNKLERRGMLHCELRDPRRALSVHAICVHLSLREADRQYQLSWLCDMVNALPANEPVVVAGDFNDWRLRAQNILYHVAGLREVHSEAFGAPAKTFPARAPMLRLDRIYVRGVSLQAPIVLPSRPWSHLSDHAPLAAEIDF